MRLFHTIIFSYDDKVVMQINGSFIRGKRGQWRYIYTDHVLLIKKKYSALRKQFIYIKHFYQNRKIFAFNAFYTFFTKRNRKKKNTIVLIRIMIIQSTYYIHLKEINIYDYSYLNNKIKLIPAR